MVRTCEEVAEEEKAKDYTEIKAERNTSARNRTTEKKLFKMLRKERPTYLKI